MNEDNLNMEIRKYLKKVGIGSQRFIEKEISEAEKKGTIKIGEEIELEMTLSIKKINKKNIILDKINLD
jgi:hypothetical protein